MKFIKNKLGFLVCLIAALSILGCNGNTAQTAESANDPQNALNLYKDACAAIAAGENWKLNITSEKAIIMPHNRYEESYTQALSYADYGQDSMRAHSHKIHTYGNSRILCEEFYDNNTLYTCFDGNLFYSEMDAQNFQNRFVPTILISPENYQTVDVHTSADITVITFADALSAEPWCNIDTASLTEAGGRITLDSEGRLVESIYSVEYTYGKTTIEEYYATNIYQIQSEDVQHVSDTDAYAHMETPDFAVLLESAVGYLSRSNTVSSIIQETISSQAVNVQYNLTTRALMQNADTNLRASVTYDSTLIDYSRNGEQITSEQTEKFIDGQYSFVDADGVVYTDQTVSSSAMQELVLNLLVQNIATPDHILNASIHTTDATVVLEFTMDEEMAHHLKQYACDTLSLDNTLLDSLSQSYHTEYITGTVTLDRISGLPTQITIRYAGEHSIEGQAYRLTYDLTQALHFDAFDS